MNNPKLDELIICPCCKKSFYKKVANQKVCSKECSNKYWGRTSTIGIATSSVGAISEMMICSEMLKRGYSVFRTISNASFCDVVAIKASEILLIEVRTGYRQMGGADSFPKNLHNKIATPTHYGVYFPRTNEILLRKITKSELKKFSIKEN